MNNNSSMRGQRKANELAAFNFPSQFPFLLFSFKRLSAYVVVKQLFMTATFLSFSLVNIQQVAIGKLQTKFV